MVNKDEEPENPNNIEERVAAPKTRKQIENEIRIQLQKLASGYTMDLKGDILKIIDKQNENNTIQMDSLSISHE